MTSSMPDSGLLEREAELRRLEAVVAGALDRRGGMVVVHGPAGIGKTRLLDVTRALAADAGCRVLAARGGDLERSFPYGVVRQLLEPVVGDADHLFRGARSVFSTLGPDGEDGPEQDAAGAGLHGLFATHGRGVEGGPLDG